MRGVSDLQVGARVTVMDRGGYAHAPVAIRTIARRTERKLVDDSGAEWNARNGDRWGAGGDSWSRGPFIRPTEPDDADHMHAVVAQRDVMKLLDAARNLAAGNPAPAKLGRLRSLRTALSAWIETALSAWIETALSAWIEQDQA